MHRPGTPSAQSGCLFFLGSEGGNEARLIVLLHEVERDNEARLIVRPLGEMGITRRRVVPVLHVVEVTTRRVLSSIFGRNGEILPGREPPF